MGRRGNTASIYAESSDGECDDEDGDKDDDGDGDAGIHAEPSVGRRGVGIGCKRMPLEFANLAQAFIPQAIYLQLMPMVKLNSRFNFFSRWRGLNLGSLQSQIL